MKVFSFLKECWRSRGQTFLVTRTVLKYDTSSKYYGQPFHLPEVVGTKFMHSKHTQHAPRWTRYTLEALPVTFLKGWWRVVKLRKREAEQHIEYGLIPLEEARFIQWVRSQHGKASKPNR